LRRCGGGKWKVDGGKAVVRHRERYPTLPR
jgi:hypothetical protein